MSSDSKEWGPVVWYMIHQIAYSYIRDGKAIPTREQRILKNFYTSLSHLLPCPSCKEHYTQTLKKNPVINAVNTGSSIFEWTVKAHNLANKGLKKKIVTLPEALNIHSAPFNENHLLNFVKHMLVLSGNKNWQERRLMAVCLINLYPTTSRTLAAALALSTKEAPREINGSGQMTNWSKKLYDVIRKA